MLVAAYREFVASGYERASMDAIAAGAGVSKATVYAYHGSKAALYEAAVLFALDLHVTPLESLALDPADPSASLTRLGERVIALLHHPDVVGLYRLVVEATGRHGDVSRAVYVRGHQRIVDIVARYLRQSGDAGAIALEDADAAAERFVSLFVGRSHLRAVLGVGHGNPDLRQEAVQATRFFLDAADGSTGRSS